MITTPAAVSHVNVSYPGFNSSDRVLKTTTVQGNTYSREDISSDVCIEGPKLSTKAVIVTSDQDIALFCFYSTSTSTSGESFLALPTDMIGCTYYVVAWLGGTAQFVVIATENNTIVQVQLPSTMSQNLNWNNNSYSSSDTISQHLDQYETWQLQVSEGDISGTLIKSNADIAVISGNIKTNVGDGTYQDHLVEMLTSVDKWGKQFIVVSTPERTASDQIKIVASQNNTVTEVTGDNSMFINIPSAGDIKTFSLIKQSTIQLTATKPIMVIQFSASGLGSGDKTDASMIFVVPLEQYRNNYRFAAIDHTFSNYLVIVCPANEYLGLVMNDWQTTLSNEQRISINSTDYITGYVTLEAGIVYTLSHIYGHVKFWAWLYGRGSRPAAYTVPAGMNLDYINKITNVSERISIPF